MSVLALLWQQQRSRSILPRPNTLTLPCILHDKLSDLFSSFSVELCSFFLFFLLFWCFFVCCFFYIRCLPLLQFAWLDWPVSTWLTSCCLTGSHHWLHMSCLSAQLSILKLREESSSGWEYVSLTLTWKQEFPQLAVSPLPSGIHLTWPQLDTYHISFVLCNHHLTFRSYISGVQEKEK